MEVVDNLPDKASDNSGSEDGYNSDNNNDNDVQSESESVSVSSKSGIVCFLSLLLFYITTLFPKDLYVFL